MIFLCIGCWKRLLLDKKCQRRLPLGFWVGKRVRTVCQ